MLAWSLRDVHAAVLLGVPHWQRDPMGAGRSATPRTVLVTGATGFVGRAVTRALVERGDRVVALSRDPAKARNRFGPLVEVCGHLEHLDPSRRIDAIVNLAGEPLAGGFWTKARKRRFVESRVGVTETVIALIAPLHVEPAVLISGSAIGYYGNRGEARLTETSSPSLEFTANLCQRWEAAALEAVRWDVRVCRLRLGLVLGADGGPLPALARAVRFFAGMVMGDGRQFVSWIHRSDLVRLILFALDQPGLAGPINAVAPEPMRQAAFMRGIGQVLRRPILARVPAWALRLALGQFSELLLASQNVMPDRALAGGFQFTYPTGAAALADLLGAGTQADTPAAVFVNNGCAVCRTEMQHYRGIGTHDGRRIDYVSIDCLADGLPEYGLTAADLRRRLFVEKGGRLLSGVDAGLTLWAALPVYRHLAWLFRQPGLRQVADLAYEGVAVPVLARLSRRIAAAKGAVA